MAAEHAGLLVAIFLPTFGVAFVVASTTLFYLFRRRRLQRIRLDSTTETPAPPVRKYVVRGGKMVPARPISSNRPPGWSTPHRLSRYFSGVSIATKSRVSTLRLSMMPSIKERDSVVPPLPANSRLQRRAAEQQLTLDLEKGVRPHGRPEFVSPPLPTTAPLSSQKLLQTKQSSIEIQTSLNRAIQMEALETPYGPEPAMSPPAPAQHSHQRSRSSSVTRTGPSIQKPFRPTSQSTRRVRQNLSGQSFYDNPSQEQLKTFPDSPVGSPPQKASSSRRPSSAKRSPPQEALVSPKTTSPLIALSPPQSRSPPQAGSPPTPAYHSPLQSRFYVDPSTTDRSTFSRTPSRIPSRLPSVSNRWGSIGSVSGAPPLPHSRHPSQPSRLNSVSSIDTDAQSVGLGISAAASPISPATFLSHTNSSNQH